MDVIWSKLLSGAQSSDMRTSTVILRNSQKLKPKDMLLWKVNLVLFALSSLQPCTPQILCIKCPGQQLRSTHNSTIYFAISLKFGNLLACLMR